jgi:predicted membrane-bound spermidine synthase
MNIKKIQNSNKKKLFSLNLIIIVILIEGFVTLSAQVITLRQLIPFVGNTVIVTGTVIAFFLLFLALGYRKGGQYKKNFLKILKTNFFYSSLLLGFGLSYLFLELFFDVALFVDIPRIIILILYLFVITSPMVYLLGQTIPITTNLAKGSSVGEISGNTLFLSTIGSCFGSIITVVILFNLVGIAYTVFINFILLSLLIFLLSEKNKEDSKMKSSIIIFSIIIFFINIGFETTAFSKTNLYGNYSFEEVDISPLIGEEIPNKGRVLAVNRGFQSFLNNEKKGFPYLEFIKRVLFKDLKLTKKNILVLGAGGFSLSAESDYDNNITYVDIDPDIYQLVKNNFLEKINGDFVASDARIYIKKSKEKYDVIITDTYEGLSLPFHLITIEHLKNIKSHLSENGLAIFNIIGDASLGDLFTKRIDNTLRHAFGNCLANTIEYNPKKRTNIVYICNINKMAEDNVFYTDNKNMSALDFFK